MKMVIEFDCDNAAFESNTEIGWILRKLANKMEDYDDNQEVSGAIIDSNGNSVGYYSRLNNTIPTVVKAKP